MRNIPDGSTYTVKNNLIVLTKQDGDVRKMTMAGADIRKTMTMADGTAGHVTLNFDNNYSTNTFYPTDKFLAIIHGLRLKIIWHLGQQWFCYFKWNIGSSCR